MNTYKNDQLGYGISSVLFISRWMSANAMFTASFITLTYGIMAGVLYGMIGAIAFSMFGLVGKFIRNKRNILTPFDLWKDKLESKTAYAFYAILGIVYALDFLLLAKGASIIFYATFHLPANMGVLLFMLLGLPLIFFRPLQRARRYAIYKFGFFQTILIVVFVYLFLSENLETMHFKMRLYHPYLFSIQVKELFLLFIVIFVIFFGKLLGDLGSWMLMFRTKKEKLRGSLILSGFIWATIPTAFSIIIFPVLGLGGYENIRTIYHDLLHLFEYPVLLIFLSAIILGTLISTYFERLQDFFYLLETRQSAKQKRNVYLLSILVLMIMYGGYYFVEPSILDLFFFIGVLNASLLLPILFILLSNSRFSKILLLITILSVSAGYLSLLIFDGLHSVLVSFLISAILLVIYDLATKLFSRES
ncbi:hypothetical protein [Pseudoneobacillus sp. C159]